MKKPRVKKAPTRKRASKSPPKKSTPTIIDRHQWTHDGAEVLILKHVGTDGETYNGFRWPLTVGATVENPNWSTAQTCESGGLFGWAWGFSLGDGKEPDWTAIWIVFGAVPADVVSLSGKVKAHRATVRYVGDWQGATNFVLAGQMAWVHHAAQGAASATGERGAASATGWSGAASATGWSGAASATGESGAASATGWSGAASATGWRGAASATGGSSIAAVTGFSGRTQGGPYSALALAWWNPTEKRQEMRAAEIGIGDGSDGKLKRDVWYRLDTLGQFVEEAPTRRTE